MSVDSSIPDHKIIEQVDVNVLRPQQTSGGDYFLKYGDEVLLSSDHLIEKLQPFPGQILPDLNGRTSFPIPDSPGEYCDRSTFEKLPKFMAQWVHWKDRTDKILQGKYFELQPAHYEGIFTLVCNFVCPHCTRRTTRLRWVDGGTWDNNTPVEEANTLHPTGLKRAIDQLAEIRTDKQMGIVWGGGDPTGNPFSYDGMMYAKSKGITSSFLTNGVLLDVEKCLEAEPILIRISLNCGTEEAYQKFHGYPKSWDYFAKVKKVMRELSLRKQERKAKTLFGISLIIDERNMEDVVEAAKEIRSIVEETGPGIDYVIVRPVMNYEHFEGSYAKLNEDTKIKAQALVEPGGEVFEILKSINVPLISVKDSFENAPPATVYDEASECLAYGICGEIRHNGDVQICSESYGNPEFTIGNLFDNSISDILKSDRRRNVLKKLNDKNCYENNCPHNSRGHHHNRVFHKIEKFRRAGEMHKVEKWVKDLRECTYDLGHSFFI